ncbi:FAD-binding oxidoreductase [Corallococcus sp. M34]|uniref:FAD-binding oxidoreductase n=1 Tax=Citreicoccus inhibens TaxID=2849499 RepID=UPI001C21CF23|nr:FAD-binding oxidoreductase [Citreicoccus inhibens]MBU8894283.1 FAD-binding oxidoreductase [Citreicoccus inhibens]
MTSFYSRSRGAAHAAAAPGKVYRPRTPDEVVAAVREAHSLAQPLVLRGGASTGQTPVPPGGAVLSLASLERIAALDEGARTVTVEAGARLESVDAYLLARGFGLPIGSGDARTTAGGWASMGGAGPASLRHGLFIDNVRELEYVTWEGVLRRCGRAHEPRVFQRLLGGAGRYGVLVRLMLDILPGDKREPRLLRTSVSARGLEDFVRGTLARVQEPDDARMALGVYAEGGTATRRWGWGRFSTYRDVPLRSLGLLTRAWTQGTWTGARRIAGWGSRGVGRVRAGLWLVGGLLHPRLASIHDVEQLPVGACDGVGLLVPAEHYGELLLAVFPLLRRACADQGDAVLRVTVLPVRSGMLGQGDSSRRYCELVFQSGAGLASQVAERTAGVGAELDVACARYEARRFPEPTAPREPSPLHEVDLLSRDAQHPPAPAAPRGLRLVD